MASDRAKRELAAYKRQGQTETIVFRPAAGDAVERDALVNRGPFEQIFENMKAPMCKVTLLNDADEGIDAVTLDRGADNIDVAEVVGREATTRGIQQLAEQDSDWLTLDVI